MSPFLIGLAVVGVISLLSSFRILMEYERGVVFRLGKLTRAKGPGLVWILPWGVERMQKMDLRILALDIPPQDTITKDNVSVTVNAVVYFRVADPTKAVIEIEDFFFATSQLAQTTLRSVTGQSELDELLAERERINVVVREIIDEGTDPWGVEVTGVEIKDIGLPQEMKRAMAKQAEAERERRAKVISAEGEFQASRRLAQAAKVLEIHPAALQLRFLQTVVEVAAENNSTTLFPIPIDLFKPFIESASGTKGGAFERREASAGLDEVDLEPPALADELESGDAYRELAAGDPKKTIAQVAKALGMKVGREGPTEDETGESDEAEKDD